MGRRVFYIVHLDRGRIAALSFFGAGLLLTAFATGYRFAPRVSQSLPESARSMGPDAAESSIPAISLTNDNAESPAENRNSNDRREQKREKVNLLDAAMPDGSSVGQERKDSSDNRSEKRREEIKPVKNKKRTEESVTVIRAVKEKRQDKPAEKITRKNNTEKQTANKNPAPVKTEKVEEKDSVYVLQMGAYQSREAALRLSELIRKHGISTYVRKTGKIHTVRTDGTTNREELFRLEKKLKSLNFSPVTVRVQGR